MAAVLDQTPNKAETASNLFAASIPANSSPTNTPDYSSVRSKVKYASPPEIIVLYELFVIDNLFFFQTALVSPNEEQFDLLLQRLKHRLEEGRGEAIFDVGVGDG